MTKNNTKQTKMTKKYTKQKKMTKKYIKQKKVKKTYKDLTPEKIAQLQKTCAKTKKTGQETLQNLRETMEKTRLALLGLQDTSNKFEQYKDDFSELMQNVKNNFVNAMREEGFQSNTKLQKALKTHMKKLTKNKNKFSIKRV